LAAAMPVVLATAVRPAVLARAVSPVAPTLAAAATLVVSPVVATPVRLVAVPARSVAASSPPAVAVPGPAAAESALVRVPGAAVDEVEQWRAGEPAGEVGVEDRRDLLRRAGPGNVRRDHDVVEPPQRMLGGQRLGVEHVEDRAGDAARAERLDQRGLVDDGAA